MELALYQLQVIYGITPVLAESSKASSLESGTSASILDNIVMPCRTTAGWHSSLVCMPEGFANTDFARQAEMIMHCSKMVPRTPGFVIQWTHISI